jgi:ComF family protein
MVGSIKKIFNAVTHFVFPFNCVACENELPESFEQICPICLGEMSRTYFESFDEETPLDQLFYGRVQLKFTYAFLYFQKGSNTQTMIHAIKYKNNKNLANTLGEMCGEALNIKLKGILPDVLISVPLHPKKQHIRGYNQGAEIAKGLSKALNIPFIEEVLVRQVFTETQTKKGKYARWSNVETVFNVKNPEKWQGKHICLVDDVITTGSTLEACVRILQEKINDVQVSIFGLAYAK